MGRTRRSAGLVVFGLALLLVLFGPGLVGLYVDWLWFGEVGRRGVYWTLLGTRWGLGLAFGVAAAALAYLNLAIARRATPRSIPPPNAPEWQRAVGNLAREGLAGAALLGSVLLGVLVGSVAASRWEEWLLFRNAERFGVRDPLFGQDVSFYVFQLPFLQTLSGTLMTALVLVTLGTAAIYYLEGAVDVWRGELRIPSVVRAHLSVLLGLALLAKALDFWLDQYGLLQKPGSLLFGAGYTDAHTRLFALRVLTWVAVIAAAGFFVNARLRALWLPGLALAVMAVAGVTIGSLYPALVQRFVVEPDQQARERPYIQHHLDATRRAYGLDGVKTREYRPGRALSPADLRTEQATLQNVRLWDYRVLAQTFQRIQGLRNYYSVADVDIDRYTIDGVYRQVMLAARELLPSRLEQRRWVNETLQYTHGYGLVMCAVNEVDQSGRPLWFVHNLPLEVRKGVEVTRPQLYYGLRDNPPVIAPSNTPEFDYPKEDGSAVSSYEGTGGIPLSSGLRRFLFSAYLGDWNILISDQVTPRSKILIRRDVRERVRRLAPFLHLDHDPYLVILDGRLVWIQDAYTTAESYPYSEPSAFEETEPLAQAYLGAEQVERGVFNYIRNSVKATVDAYTGEVTLYAVDESDPLLRTYRRAFPGLFTPDSDVPDQLRAHFRYPEGLFYLQARKLRRFHVTDPNVFYARSDEWDFPVERVSEEDGIASVPMVPYYVVMRLPGETKEEFALILPFKTRAGTTMPGWLAARCDPGNYGELRLFRFPSSIQVDAPEQVDGAILANRRVAESTTLLGQRGSRVRYGNLLVLPVGQTLLYAKPFYVEGVQQGQGGGIPQLEYVILAERREGATRVVMEPTLRQALEALVGGAAPAGPAPPPQGEAGRAPAPAAGAAQLAAEAEAAFDAADRALRSGNWTEFGRQIERARAAVRRLRAATGGSAR